MTRILRAAALLVPLLAALPALAVPLLVVDNANQAETIAAGQARAFSFTLANTETDVTVGAPVLCIGCTGGVWFQKNAIGSTASFAGTLGGSAFSSTTTVPFFTFSTLTPGTYFLIVSIDSTSTGSAIWSGSTAPTVTTADGAGRGLDFLATSTSPYVPFSTFAVTFGTGLNATVTADAQPVPEPLAALLLAQGALVALAVRRRA